MKVYRPTSAGMRFRTGSDFSEVTRTEPNKGLVEFLKAHGGRNANGHITSRHNGGRHRRLYRLIDFRRDKLDVPGKVESIEYDPNRSARIALVVYNDGERRYIIAPNGLKVGQRIVSSNKEAEIVTGNALVLKNIPVGTNIYNIELKPGRGGQIARSAGCTAQLMGREENGYVLIKMPSGEVRRINDQCRATIGQVGNIEHENISIGKAGRQRWVGKRPQSRGTVMNPVDHPHGGGHGRDHGGRHPVTPWGQPTKGYKTRNNKRTNAFIVRRRK